MTPQDLAADLRSRINPLYAAQLGTESYERRLCAEAIEGLIADRDEWRDEALSAQERFKAAEDKLVALRWQEPVDWQKRHPLRTDGVWKNTDEYDAKWWRDNSKGWEVRPLFLAAGAQPVPTMESIKNAAKAAGLEFDCFSYEGTNQLVDFVAMLAAAPVQAGAEPAQDGFALLPKSVIEMTLNCLCTPERANLRLVLRDLNKAMLAAAPVQAQEQRKPSVHEDAIFIGRHKFLEWNRALQRPLVEIGFDYSVFDAAIRCYIEAAHGIKEKS